MKKIAMWAAAAVVSAGAALGTGQAHADWDHRDSNPAQFLADAHATGFNGGEGGDATLLRDGYSHCQALANGVTWYDMRMVDRRTLVPKGYTVDQVEHYSFIAINDLCPYQAGTV